MLAVVFIVTISTKMIKVAHHTSVIMDVNGYDVSFTRSLLAQLVFIISDQWSRGSKWWRELWETFRPRCQCWPCLVGLCSGAEVARVRFSSAQDCNLIILIIASIRIKMMIIISLMITIFHHHPNRDYNWFRLNNHHHRSWVRTSIRCLSEVGEWRFCR